MPIRPFLLMLCVAILAAGGTIAVVYATGLSFVWVALVALLATLLVRRWT